VRVVPRKDELPPSRPTALRVTHVGATEVALHFGRARDEFGVARYEIVANGRRVATSRTTRPTVAGLRCATAYTFTARAVDRVGHRSKPSPPARARTRPCTDGTAPTAPAAIEVASVSDVAVALRWPASADAEGNLAGYIVTRDGAELGRPTAAEYVAAPLAAQRTYTFGVRARDRSGNVSAETTVTVTTTAPVQSTGLVHAFLLASDGQSFRDFQARYAAIDVVYPTYYDVKPDGTLKGADQPHVTRFAQQRGVKVMPRVNTQTPSTIQTVLSDPAIRNRLVGEIARVAREHGFDGINLDFEAGAASLRPLYTQFVTDVTAALHAQGDQVSVAVSATTSHTTTGRAGFYDYAALSSVADELFVMAWNEHWSTSPAGPLASVGWLNRILAYLDTFNRPGKFTVGTHMYGMDWPQGAKAAAVEWSGITALRDAVGAPAGYDAVAREPMFTYDAGGVLHTVYYADGASIAERLGMYRARGFGMGVWRLGREDGALWSNPVVWP
jgi:spore germination protein YaaH